MEKGHEMSLKCKRVVQPGLDALPSPEFMQFKCAMFFQNPTRQPSCDLHLLFHPLTGARHR
jgi:hypothetical protein